MSGPAYKADRVRYDTGCATDIGNVRTENVDSYIVLPEHGLWAVADGMGGHARRRFASQTVVNALGTIGDAAAPANQIASFHRLILAANVTIRTETCGSGVIGTTVAAVLIHGTDLACAWVGDSRVYRLRGGAISQLTHDHAEAQELLDLGVLSPEQAKSWPRHNVITRAVGVFEDPQLEVKTGEVRAGDRFILCSDGLTGHVADEEIAATAGALAPQSACEALVATALQRGGTDNVTVIIVGCVAEAPAPGAGGR